MMRTMLGVLGVVLLIISAAFVVEASSELVQGSSKSTVGTLLAVIVIFLGTGWGGFRLARPLFKRHPGDPAQRKRTPEQLVLQLAETRQGRVTLPEVAAHCALSVTESKKLLERLATEGAAELLVSEHGVIVYEFPGFVPGEKASAQQF
ncbi:MAG: hypothetical protein IT307_12630 [Chloroflexi bacterium]|nr:hypothetical protein [Chloroflexota bacterium]